MDMFLVRYNGIRTVSLTCDCTWASNWSALPVHLTTLIEHAERHLREAHGGSAPKSAEAVEFCNWCPEPTSPDPRSHPAGQRAHISPTDTAPSPSGGGS